jgi:hypothetical protein
MDNDAVTPLALKRVISQAEGRQEVIEELVLHRLKEAASHFLCCEYRPHCMALLFSKK